MNQIENNKIKKCCFECAMCSEHYPSFKTVCDEDEHKITDAESEVCAHFVELGE